jgi:hypothetical protein
MRTAFVSIWCVFFAIVTIIGCAAHADSDNAVSSRQRIDGVTESGTSDSTGNEAGLPTDPPYGEPDFGITDCYLDFEDCASFGLVGDPGPVVDGGQAFFVAQPPPPISLRNVTSTPASVVAISNATNAPITVTITFRETATSNPITRTETVPARTVRYVWSSANVRNWNSVTVRQQGAGADEAQPTWEMRRFEWTGRVMGNGTLPMRDYIFP